MFNIREDFEAGLKWFYKTDQSIKKNREEILKVFKIIHPETGRVSFRLDRNYPVENQLLEKLRAKLDKLPLGGVFNSGFHADGWRNTDPTGSVRLYGFPKLGKTVEISYAWGSGVVDITFYDSYKYGIEERKARVL